MIVLKAINVDEEVFKEFRKLSIENDLKVGEMLKELVESYKKQKGELKNESTN